MGVTRHLVHLIQEHRDAVKEIITESMINTVSVKDLDMYKMAQYKGQLHALDALLDIEEFLSERVEVKQKDLN